MVASLKPLSLPTRGSGASVFDSMQTKGPAQMADSFQKPNISTRGAWALLCCVRQTRANEQAAKLKIFLLNFNEYCIFTYTKKEGSTATMVQRSPVILQVRRSGICRLPLEISSNKVDDLLHALPSGGFRLRHQTINDRG